MAVPTPTTDKMSKFKRYQLKRSLRTGVDYHSKMPLSQERIKANLAQLVAHFASGGDSGGQKMAEIMADMHPTVQGVYQLMQDQTKTIVAAIDARADSIDERLKNQDSTLANLAMGVERTSRLLMGHALPEDQSGMSNRELLAQNCQAVRSLQSQNINLRAQMKAAPEAGIDEQRRDRMCAWPLKTSRRDAMRAENKKTREDAKATTDAEKKAVSEAKKEKKDLEKGAEKAKKDLEKEAEKTKKELENANNPKPKRKRSNIREVKGKTSPGVAAGEEAPPKRRITRKTCQLIICTKPDTTQENIDIMFATKGEQLREQPGENEVPFATEVTDEAESEEGLDVN
jgi:hypothetical protein